MVRRVEVDDVDRAGEGGEELEARAQNMTGNVSEPLLVMIPFPCSGPYPPDACHGSMSTCLSLAQEVSSKSWSAWTQVDLLVCSIPSTIEARTSGGGEVKGFLQAERASLIKVDIREPRSRYP